MLVNAEKFSAKSNIKASHTPHIVQVQDQIEGHFIKQIVRQSPFCFWNLGFKSNPKFCHSIWTWVSHFYSLSLKMASATHNYRAGQKVVVFWESLVKHSGDKKKGCWNCIHVVVAWTIPPLTIEVCLPSMLRIMIKVSAYILSVHSSSGFYEELHQVVVTLPSRQVKRLKLGDWRFARDFFSDSKGLNLVVGWTFPSFELFLDKALFEEIFWNI